MVQRTPKGLGKRLTADMNKTLQSIAAIPWAFAVRKGGYRLAVIPTW